MSYEVAWADGQYQNRIRALSRSGEKLVRRRTSAAAAPALERRRQQTGEVAAAPPPLRAAAVTGDWCAVGKHVEDANDATVRGVITNINRSHREVTTTTSAVVMLRPGQLTEATLTDEEVALCVRPTSQKDYVQARIDGAIRFSFDGREFKNRYTCADGTECRQFEVTATGARCALCPDVRSWSLETDFLGLLGNLKNHCGQGIGDQRPSVQLHRERLASAAAAPLAAEPVPQPTAAVNGNWRIVGAQVEDVDDSTVRGVIIDCPKGWREVATTTGAVVMLKLGQLTLSLIHI